MTRHYFFVNGRRVAQLPAVPVAPPAGVHALKWLLRPPFDGYGIDARRQLWHLPYTTQHGRRRGWQLIRNVVKSGSPTYTLRLDGRPVQRSQRQLRAYCYRNPDWRETATPRG
jgi:hypothetical protein